MESYIFSGKLITGNDPAINFDLVKYITKILDYDGKVQGGLSLAYFHGKGETYQQDLCSWRI